MSARTEQAAALAWGVGVVAVVTLAIIGVLTLSYILGAFIL